MFGNTSFGSSFGATPSLNAFGSTTQTAVPVGTTIRFVPLSGTDTVQRTGTNAGGPSQITTKHQNISAMKEYESKSVDELRLEDYAAGRKVGQPQTGFTFSPFSTMQPSTSQQSNNIFGGTSTQPTTNLFATPNANQNNNIFGGNKTNFELNSSSNIFSSANKPAVSSSPFSIGQPNGATTSTGQTGFSLFNTNNPTNSTPFGASSNNSPFKPNLFASPASNTGSIFNNQTNTSTSSFLGATTTNQPQSTFGAGNSIFGSNTTQPVPSLSNNSTQNIFGPQKFGFELNNSTNLFNTSAKPNASAASSTLIQPQTSFTSAPFSAMQPSTSQQSNNIFGGTSTQPTTNLFASPNQNNSIFGDNKSNFGLNSTSNIFNTANKPAVSSSPFTLGQPSAATTSTSQAGFSLFNNNNNQTTTTPFGASTNNSPFKPNLFASPSSNTNSIFNTQTNTGTSGFLGATTTNQPQSTFGSGNSIFGSSTAPTVPNLSNNTAPSLFGLNTTQNLPSLSTNSTQNLFGQNPVQTASLSNNPTQNLFGTQTFGFEQNHPTNLFSTSAKTNTTLPNSPPDLLLNRLKTLPYGEDSLFLTSPGLGSLKFTTDPNTIKQYKMNAKTNVKLNKPPSAEKSSSNSVLFDGLDDNPSDDLRCALDVFVPKKSIKKLDLKPISDGGTEPRIVSSPERTRSGAS